MYCWNCTWSFHSLFIFFLKFLVNPNIILWTCLIVCVFSFLIFVPAERSSWGDYETGSVRVCVCVRPSVRAQTVKVCFFSVISWPSLILFVLSDRAWCGLQKFYTEFWNSFIMQIYTNLFKINEKCYFSVISWPILILFVLSDRAWCGLQNFYTEFWNSLIMQIYSKSMKNATSPLFRNHNSSALPAGTYILRIA